MLYFDSYVPLHVSDTCAHPQEDPSIFISGSMSVSFGDRTVGRLVRDCSKKKKNSVVQNTAPLPSLM